MGAARQLAVRDRDFCLAGLDAQAGARRPGRDEAGQRRYNSPANQYSSDPDPRSDFMQEQIAGDFKDEVAEKENPEDQSELLAGDGQLSVHGQRRKPNIVAIE